MLFAHQLLVDILESHELGLSASGGVGGIVGVTLPGGGGVGGSDTAERTDHVREDPSLRFLAVGETSLDVAHFLAGSLFARDRRLPTAASDAAE